MTRGEIDSLELLKRHFPNADRISMLKKLGEEITELSMAIANGDEKNIKEEVGDMAFILLHILSTTETSGIITEIVIAADKLQRRIDEGYYNQ